MIRLLFLLLLLVSVGTMRAQQATDTPKAGEGITNFLIRNNRPGQTYYRQFLQLNKKKLRGKEELWMGVYYLLPPLQGEAAQTTDEPEEAKASEPKSEREPDAETASEPKRKGRKIKEPLFGRENAQVQVTGNRLKGACFYVVSGHGGPDPGAIGRIGKTALHEDEYAYDVALRLARNLMQQGAEVRIIIQDKKDGIRDGRHLKNSKRETCMGKPIPLNQVARLQQRCDKINELYACDRKKYKYCRTIFLHVDSRSKRTQTDVFFYHAPESSQGKRLANTMKRTFESKYGKHQPNRGFEGTVSGRNLFVLRHSTPVAVFVELGNIQNSFDQRRFVISSNRQALAKWMMEAFIADYKRNK